ncbi:MAG: 6-bladed beta-propeller [Mediterranea sp.]|jgi:hypothetical protein|nr:6-bladed beta-propeller [Mediterranea sp.]
MKYLLIMCSALLFVSCKRPIPKSTIPIQGKATTIYVDWDEAAKDTDTGLSPFVDSIRYVQLETNDSALMQSVRKVCVQGDYIYVQDAYNKIVKYDKIGRFQSVIGHVGLGPGEYASVQDFCMYKGLIEILDLEGRKLLSYHASDGTFVRSTPLRMFFYYFLPIVGHHYLADINIFLSNGGMGTLLLDSLANQKERLLSWGEYPTLMNNINAFSAISDSTYGIFSQPDYTVYYYTYPNILRRKYEYKFSGGKTFSSFANVHSTDLFKGNANGGLISPLFYVENRMFVLSLFSYQTKGYTVLYDKQRKVSTVSVYPSVSEAGCLFFCPTGTPNLMVGKVPYSVLEALKNAPKNKLNKPIVESPLYDIALQSKPDDNPVIQLIYLKHANP